MKKAIKKKSIDKKPIQKDRIENDVLTREKFRPIFEDIKELIISTAKGTEKVLREEIRGVSGRLDRVEIAVSEHTKQIKQLDVKIDGVRAELKEESQSIRTELKEEIQGVRTELKEESQSIRTELKEEIQGLRTELKDEMHQMEARLSDKIDGHSTRLDDHESRISIIESAGS